MQNIAVRFTTLFVKQLPKNISAILTICDDVSSLCYVSDTCCVPTRNIVEEEILLTNKFSMHRCVYRR